MRQGDLVLTLGAALLAATLGVSESVSLYSASLLPRVAYAAQTANVPREHSAATRER